MDLLLTLGGLILIAAGLEDMFHTLLHPTGQGRLTAAVLRGVWRLSRASGHRAGTAVGPMATVAVMLVWALLQTLGWALLYLPHVPEGLLYAQGLEPGAPHRALDALYLSSVTLATLGFGDVVPTGGWMRILAPAEGLTGFALLTAACTWFSQLYPPLARRHSLAMELRGLGEARWAQALHATEPAVATRVLDGLTTQLIGARADLGLHSECYYFRDGDPDLSLARHLPRALELRDAALAAPDRATRRSGARLGAALDRLLSHLDREFLRTGAGESDVLRAFADDHAQGGERSRVTR